MFKVMGGFVAAIISVECSMKLEKPMIVNHCKETMIQILLPSFVSGDLAN